MRCSPIVLDLHSPRLTRHERLHPASGKSRLITRHTPEDTQSGRVRMNEEGLSFRCKKCGSRELYVEHQYSIIEEIMETLECSCRDEKEFAAQHRTDITTSYAERSPLDEDHRIGPTEETDTLDTNCEQGDWEVLCHKCLSKAEEGDWTSEIESSEVDDDSVEFFVFCADCDREIEFGWSHPERGGANLAS